MDANQSILLQLWCSNSRDPAFSSLEKERHVKSAQDHNDPCNIWVTPKGVANYRRYGSRYKDISHLIVRDGARVDSIVVESQECHSTWSPWEGGAWIME